jgi:hypothetical protein
LTFSRSCAEFAQSQLAQRVHAAVIDRPLSDQLVGHVSRDSTAIVARESHKSRSPKLVLNRKNEGGQIISTQTLVWTGAEQGNTWKTRPLPLGNSKHCAFHSSITKVLDVAGIDWIDIVASADDFAIEAMISADLCISAELEFAKHLDRVAVDHGGQLPDLPEFSIVLYCSDRPDNHLALALVEYFLRAYA